MAKITFQYRSTKEIGKLSIRLTNSKLIDLRTSTPIISEKKYWFKRTTKKGKPVLIPKQLNDLNGADAKIKLHKEELRQLHDVIISNFITDNNKGVPITKEWLKSQVDFNTNVLDTKEKIKQTVDAQNKIVDAETKRNEFIKTSNLLTNAIEKMFNKYQTNYNELKKYKVTCNLVLKYQNDNNVILTTENINQYFADTFKNWCTIDMQYSKSYVNSQLKRIKASVSYAYENDEVDIIKISKQLNSFKMFSNPYKDKIVITLNYDELDKIDKTEINNPQLLDAKKSILIGCETGLRYSDMNKLIDTNIKNVDGVNYWMFRTQKTDAIVQITITDRILYLIDKYGLPISNYPINNVKLNKDIKEVCKISKINETIKGSKATVILINGQKETRSIKDYQPKNKLITTRTFRRSFATNYYGQIDTSLITAITGHKTELQLKSYINEEDTSNITRSKKQIDAFHELTALPKASNQN